MALKLPNNPIILEVQDYKDLYGIPKEDIQTLNRISLWIEQATNQFDSLISGNNEIGTLFRWWENLDDNNLQDNQKGLKLQRAIGGWVETFIQNGKFWTDNIPVVNANFNIDIQSSSENSNVESKRNDLIQDLVALGLYKTSNIAKDDNEEMTEKEIDDLIIISKKYLEENFMRRTPQWPLSGNIDMSSNSLDNVNNIKSSYPSGNRSSLIGFKLEGCDIGEIENANNANKILDPIDNIYKLINKFDISYWNGLTKEETYYAIFASNTIWNPTFNYRKDFVVQFTEITKGSKKSELKWALSLIDNNIGNNPNTSPLEWKVFETPPVDISEIIKQLEPYIALEVEKQINELPIAYQDKPNIFTENQTIAIPAGETKVITVQKNGIPIFNILQSNSSNNIQLYAPEGILYLAGKELNFSNKELENIATPTKNTSATNKKYVDDNLLLKQNKLIAGANITITGDTISSTGGGTPILPSNVVYNDKENNFTEDNKFTNIEALTTKSNEITLAKSLSIVTSFNTLLIDNDSIKSKRGFHILSEDYIAIQAPSYIYLNGPSIADDFVIKNSGILRYTIPLTEPEVNKATNIRWVKEYTADAIKSKADNSAIDSINVELGVQSTNITQNANDIALKASQVALDQLTAAVGTQLNTKQAKLVAGANITINPTTNEISSTGGNTTFKSGEKVDEVDYLGVINRDNILNKQNKLIAGTNITITGDTISASGGSTPDSALTSKTNTFNFRQIIKSAGTGLLDLQNATSSVLNITYILATSSINLTAPNTLTMKFGAKDYDFSGKELKNIGNPTDGNSAVNKSYVDNRNFATVGQLNLKADETYVDDKVKNMDTLYKRANTSIPSVIVAWDSTSTISTIFDSATWDLIKSSNQYYLLAYTNSVASRTRFPMVIRMEYAMSSNDYNVHTGAGDFTFFNYTNFGTTYSIKLMVALSRASGAFRFAASFNGTLNPNFTINRVEIWKKASL